MEMLLSLSEFRLKGALIFLKLGVKERWLGIKPPNPKLSVSYHSVKLGTEFLGWFLENPCHCRRSD